MDSVLRSTSGNIAASRSSFTALSAICSADLQQALLLRFARSFEECSRRSGAGSLTNVDVAGRSWIRFRERPHPDQSDRRGGEKGQ